MTDLDQLAAAEADLVLVCEIALEWAGEYGWSPAMRPQAKKVIAAVRRLRPDLIGEDLR